jgi:LysM repeat protein
MFHAHRARHAAPRDKSVARRTAGKAWRRRAVVMPLVLAAVVTGSASSITLIRVHPGDTLSAIAARYHTSVSRLIELNDLPGNGDLIYAGQTLRVPNRHAHRRRHHQAPHHSHLATIWHTVVVGDTVDGLAVRYRVKPATIARRNHLSKSLVIVLGERLAIPRRVAGEASTVSGSIGRELRILDRHAEPSRDAVAALIRSTAAKWGLDDKLALAISWQESGFSMREVSSVGAIGAMQVMPYTAAYLSADVVHRTLNLLDAGDNVTAGVALLSVLTHEAKNERRAVAGYYQGLQSVRDHGMFRSTKRYVADVMALRERF